MSSGTSCRDMLVPGSSCHCGDEGDLAAGASGSGWRDWYPPCSAQGCWEDTPPPWCTLSHLLKASPCRSHT